MPDPIPVQFDLYRKLANHFGGKWVFITYTENITTQLQFLKNEKYT